MAFGVLVGYGSRISRHSAHEGGKVITLTHRPSLPPGISWYSFLEAESTPGHMELSHAPEKIPSDRGSIPGPSRLAAQCLKHYAEIAVYVFFYVIEQHSKFLLHTLQVLHMWSLCDSTNINTIIECVPNFL